MNINFIDRVSTYPNRYKVTKGDGTSEHITLERADEPVVVGTPLNADTFNSLIGEIKDGLNSGGGVPGSVARNLLDNSDFTNPVNQMGQTSYSILNNGMTIDRWSVSSSSPTSVLLNVNKNGLTINFNGSTNPTAHMRQRLPKGVLSLDKKYTLAAYYAGEGVRIGTLETVTFGDDPFFYTDSSDFDQVAFSIKENETVVWAALYEGEYTADTLPEYQPKRDGAELAECQRYQYIVNGYLTASGVLTGDKKQLILSVPTPVSMRAKPVVSGVTISGVRTTAGSNVTPDVTAAFVDSYTPHNINIRIETSTFNTSTYTNNTPVVAYVRTCTIDANL